MSTLTGTPRYKKKVIIIHTVYKFLYVYGTLQQFCAMLKKKKVSLTQLSIFDYLKNSFLSIGA
jgi:hypothetical protein